MTVTGWVLLGAASLAAGVYAVPAAVGWALLVFAGLMFLAARDTWRNGRRR